MKITTLLISIIIIITGCRKDDLTKEEIKEKENTSNLPNILLIIADDMGKDACPGYSEGENKPDMPNLDALASEGIIFENAWSYPLCSPTRASILTGKYGSKTGILAVNNSHISQNEVTIQRYLDLNTDSAYAHAIFGKWHLSKLNDYNAPNNMGIGHFAGIMKGGLTDYLNWNLVINGTSELCTEYNTSKLTDLSIDWIKNQTKPWFCWMAYCTPHTPFHYPPAGTHNQNTADNNDFSMYLAMMENLDYEMGRLLKSIDQETKDNTIIIFLGDNGTDRKVLQLPYKGLKCKGSLYQGGINVPLIISGKGVERKNVRDLNLISTTDFFATIADIAETGTKTYNDSYSFKHLLNTEGEGLRTFNFSESDSGSDYRYAISNGTYKLISNNNKDDELFNLINDPYEDNDIFNSTNTNDVNAKQLLIQEANRLK